MSDSVFEKYRNKAWPYQFAGSLHVATIAGGIPSDERVVESWLRTKLADDDELIREAVARTMAERGISAQEASEQVASMRHFTGFKRDEQGLYIEGRQLKAAIKEAAMVAVGAGKLNLRGWGATNKFLKGFIAEHVMVAEDRLLLGVTEASGIVQQFVHTQYGSAPHYKEYVTDAKIDFTVLSDHPFTDEQWAMVWLTGEQQGIGASRSGGFGRYTVTKWSRL